VVVTSVELSDGNANISFITDITERKQAEEKLAASEAELRALFATMTDAVIVYDADGRYVEIAPTNPINFYRPLDEMVGKTVSDVLPKEQADYIVAKTREAIQTGQVVVGEYALQIGDKETWFASSATRLSENTAVWVAHDITDLKRTEQIIKTHLAELGMLYESGLILGQLLSPKEIAEKVIELIGLELNWHHTAIRLYHPEDERLELLAINLPGMTSPVKFREAEQRFNSMITKAGEGLSGWAVQHSQSLRVGELANDERYVETQPGLHSGMYVPLKVGERVVGVISIESQKPEAFSEADERLTITLANQAAIALDRARLLEETLHRLEQLQSLHAIDQAIAGSFDQRVMLDVLLTHTLSQLAAAAAVIFLYQASQGQTLQYVAGKGLHTHLFETTHMEFGNGIFGEAVARREMIHIREHEERGSEPLLSKLWLEEGFKCMEIIPLISRGEVKGVMGVFHRKEFTPNPAWKGFFETLAGQAAIAIDTTQTFDNLQRANMELAVAYEATIEGWSQAMDLRDKETEGHSQRVADMTTHMGKAFSLSDEKVNYMRRGALLHDIGKLGVPDHILLKVEKLTDDEWLIMKKHPTFAYDMLHPIYYLRDSLDIPYSHHEKWDGTGYPQGLKGEQIPLAARIFGIVDVWDALISERPYRKAWSKLEALQYIREQSGKQFEPRVVDVFLQEYGHD
jgi:PAS domain S-box-containing protein